MKTFILTKYKVYTDLEVVNLFSEHVKPENLEVLVNHLTYSKLAKNILSFKEIEGEVYFTIGSGDVIKVSKKSSLI